jgi:UDP-glucose 4-epimerase
MKIFVLGSKGFIGSNLIGSFQRYNVLVWGADVSVDYGAKNYILIDAASSFEEIFKDHKFDVCINCSGAASVSESVTNPKRDYYLNTKLVFDVLEAIRSEAPTCKFIQLSSAAVYGNPKALPIKESADTHPISPYGWHKYQSELLCREFANSYGISTLILRIFSVYGPGLKKQFFWDLYQKSILENKIKLFGTGEESRDFIFIDDVCSAIQFLVEKDLEKAEIINLASGHETKIKTVAEVFMSLLGNNFLVEFSNQVKLGDPLNWRADVGKLSALGFIQQISLEQGLKKYVEWLKEKR